MKRLFHRRAPQLQSKLPVGFAACHQSVVHAPQIRGNPLGVLPGCCWGRPPASTGQSQQARVFGSIKLAGHACTAAARLFGAVYSGAEGCTSSCPPAGMMASPSSAPWTSGMATVTSPPSAPPSKQGAPAKQASEPAISAEDHTELGTRLDWAGIWTHTARRGHGRLQHLTS